MADELTQGILNDIGKELASDTDYPLDGTFLYAECSPQSVYYAVYKDAGDRLIYRWGTHELGELLLDLWEAAEPDKRWSAIEYTVTGNTFIADFTYPDKFVGGHGSDRRDRIVQQRFGNKQVIYPPLP